MESKDKGENLKKSEERFPPELERWEWGIIGGCYVLCLLLISFFILQILEHQIVEWLPINIYLSYSAFIIILALLLIVRYLFHDINENKCRRVDPSKVEAMFVEVCTLEPRLRNDSVEKPDDYERKKREAEEEVMRLKALGNKGWTEYQVLSLDQMLIDFLKVDDLIARASSRLTDLGDYAEDSSYDLEKRQYYIWDEQMKNAISIIEEKRKEKKTEECDIKDEDVDNCAEKLRAVTRELLESVADYEQNWATGSAIMRALNIYGVQLIIILIVMGLLPLYFPGGTKILGLFSWGVLGISGSIAAVLLGLRKSNYVEVGYSLGKKEMWKTVLGTGLGLVAGILMHSMIAGGLLDGNLFPNFVAPSSGDTARSVFWGISSGFSFEMIFDRMRGVIGNA